MEGLKKKIIIQSSVSSILIVVFLVGIFFFGSSVKNSTARIGEIRNETTNRLQFVESFSKLLKDAKRGEVGLTMLQSAVPKQSELLDLSRTLQFLAERERIEYSFQFAGAETLPEGQNLGNLPFTLTLKGSTAGIIAFIQSLRTVKFTISIDSFDITQGEEKAQTLIRARALFR